MSRLSIRPSPEPHEPPRPLSVRPVGVPVELGLAPLALVGFVLVGFVWFARRRRQGMPEAD